MIRSIHQISSLPEVKTVVLRSHSFGVATGFARAHELVGEALARLPADSVERTERSALSDLRRDLERIQASLAASARAATDQGFDADKLVSSDGRNAVEDPDRLDRASGTYSRSFTNTFNYAIEDMRKIPAEFFRSSELRSPSLVPSVTPVKRSRSEEPEEGPSRKRRRPEGPPAPRAAVAMGNLPEPTNRSLDPALGRMSQGFVAAPSPLRYARLPSDRSYVPLTRALLAAAEDSAPSPRTPASLPEDEQYMLPFGSLAAIEPQGPSYPPTSPSQPAYLPPSSQTPPFG